MAAGVGNLRLQTIVASLSRTENEQRKRLMPMISIVLIAAGYVAAVACTRGAAATAAKAILGRAATSASV
jgi:hypothetical protein